MRKLRLQIVTLMKSKEDIQCRLNLVKNLRDLIYVNIVFKLFKFYLIVSSINIILIYYVKANKI